MANDRSNTPELRSLHDRLGSMIDQIGHPDYSLRELVAGLREVRDALFALSEKKPNLGPCACNGEGKCLYEQGSPSCESSFDKQGELVTVREDVIRFLLGEGPLDGVWYGDRPHGAPAYWWRNPLRLSMHPYFASSATMPIEPTDAMLDAALESLKEFGLEDITLYELRAAYKAMRHRYVQRESSDG